uniref:Cyclic nucleotide-binding domain-containing protein n=1 Tax=Bicosoecida sp. CB-2014 TaxID=1486930 RepID=A0A7S1G674_9STRA
MATLDIQAELQEYIDQHDINKMFVGIVENVLLEKPSNPATFVVEYLHKTYPDKFAEGEGGAGEAKGGEDSDYSSEDDDDDDVVDELPPLPASMAASRGRRRTAVSAEASVDPRVLREKWEKEKKTHPKSDAEKERILSILKRNVFFTHLDPAGVETLIDMFFPVEKDDGDIIIKQGETGDLFYVVDSGTPEVYVRKPGDVEPVKVLTYGEGDSFGELALMYNAPRAATVKAKGDCKLWAVDRLTFKVILQDVTSKKRDLYKGFVEKVPILASLSEYERLTIADALQPAEFEDSAVIISQGDAGDNFYIVETGEVSCTQSPSPGATPVEVMRLGAGQYFGEIALLTNQPRKATVTAVGPTKCLKLDRKTFNRVMGPLQEVLKRNMDQYNSIMAQNI